MKTMGQSLRAVAASAGLIALMAVFGLVVFPNPTLAQTPAAGPADFGKLGFPNVVATTNFSPGAAATVTGGGQTVQLAADFYKGPAKFELLTGSNSTFAAGAADRTVILAWAFRVTDTATNQLVGSFGSPVQWSFTAPAVTAQSVVLNVSAATPPAILVNGTPPTVSGQTISHPFSGSGVGWLVANPAGAAAGQSAARPAGPTTVQAPSGGAAPVAASQARLPSTGLGGLLPQPEARLNATQVLLGSFVFVAALLGAVLSRQRSQLNATR